MSQPFANEVAGGNGSLLIAQIQSPNFSLAGKTGWAILQNGDAFFFNITASGDITASEFIGTDFIINANGAYFYSGTPTAGNLIASITNANGTDPFGNTVWGGVSSYDLTDGSVTQIFDGQLLTLGNGVGIGTGAQSDMYSSGTGTFIAAGGYTVLFGAATGVNASAQMFLYDSAAGGGTPYIATPNTALAVPSIAALVSGVPEVWHYVGAAGNPAFGAGWSNVGSPNDGLAYKFLAEKNAVWVKGYVNNATAANAASVFTLPAAYRPASQQFFTFIEDPNTTITLKAGLVTTGGVVELAPGLAPAGAGNYLIDFILSLDI
jgi:hypothetical protein